MNIEIIKETMDTHIKKIEKIIQKKKYYQNELENLQKRIKEINLSNNKEILKINLSNSKEIEIIEKNLEERQRKSDEKYKKKIKNNIIDLIQELHLKSYSEKLFDNILDHIFFMINNEYKTLFKDLLPNEFLSNNFFISFVIEENDFFKFSQSHINQLELTNKNFENELKNNKDKARIFALFVSNIIFTKIYPEFVLISNKTYDDLLSNLKNKCTNKIKQLDDEKKLFSKMEMEMEKNQLDENKKKLQMKQELKLKDDISHFVENVSRSELDTNANSKLYLGELFKSYIKNIINKNELFFQKLKIKYLEDIDYCKIQEIIKKIELINE
jgi:hypothetical protein